MFSFFAGRFREHFGGYLEGYLGGYLEGFWYIFGGIFGGIDIWEAKTEKNQKRFNFVWLPKG